MGVDVGEAADDRFGHGYVVSAGSRPPSASWSWRTLDVGPFTYRFQGRTRFARGVAKEDSGNDDVPAAEVVLVGHPVDVEAGLSDIDEIARRTAALFGEGGPDAALKYVAYLGGRFTCFLHRGAMLVIVPDCHATQSVYWRHGPAGFAASSHVELVGGEGAAELDEHALRLFDRLVEIRGAAGTKYLPGVVTPYAGVRPVMPNCALHVDVDLGRAEHRRFYPFGDLPRHDVDHAYRLFEELFREHARTLCGFGRVGISLTAGLDSRVTLAGSRAFLPPGSFAFTFFRAVSPTEAHADDLFEANRLAWEYGLPHRVLRWDGRNRDQPFDRVFSATWPRLGQARTIAQTFYTQLPRDIVQFQSTIAETGTVFYKRREVADPSAKRLTHLWHGREVAEAPELVAAFEEFAEFSDFRPERLFNLDYHDAFYWEHRNARWAANRYHEADLAHRVLHPFNQRSLIEAMLSIPFEDRTAKVLLHRLVERFPPPGR